MPTSTSWRKRIRERLHKEINSLHLLKVSCCFFIINAAKSKMHYLAEFAIAGAVWDVFKTVYNFMRL